MSTLDLGFGVSLQRLVKIRRTEPQISYPADNSHEAAHCLVVLIGGKDVLVSDYEEVNGCVVADVFVTAPTAHLPQVAVPGVPGTFVDVYAAMRWAESTGWDARQLREVLK